MIAKQGLSRARNPSLCHGCKNIIIMKFFLWKETYLSTIWQQLFHLALQSRQTEDRTCSPLVRSECVIGHPIYIDKWYRTLCKNVVISFNFVGTFEWIPFSISQSSGNCNEALWNRTATEQQRNFCLEEFTVRGVGMSPKLSVQLLKA